MDSPVVGLLQGSRKSRRCLWNGMGSGRRPGFDPTKVCKR